MAGARKPHSVISANVKLHVKISRAWLVPANHTLTKWRGGMTGTEIRAGGEAARRDGGAARQCRSSLRQNRLVPRAYLRERHWQRAVGADAEHPRGRDLHGRRVADDRLALSRVPET